MLHKDLRSVFASGELEAAVSSSGSGPLPPCCRMSAAFHPCQVGAPRHPRARRAAARAARRGPRSRGRGARGAGELGGAEHGVTSTKSRARRDGVMPGAIDNNAAERAIRPLTVGRKNYLFLGSDNGGRTAATLYSLTASAKRHGLDPFIYLRDVLATFNQTSTGQLEQFLPDIWRQNQLKQLANLENQNPT